MPGARHTDWTHVHVVGDRVQAAGYVPFARKVLGAVVADAAHLGLRTHQVTQRLRDGAVVIGELRGGIPRVTIVPPPLVPRPDVPPHGKDDFVVWARDVEHPYGLDPRFPQQILRPGWTTFFHDGRTEGYAEFGGGKGTYGARFPDGLRYAANVDWRSRDGERIHWYGPSSRYFVDGCRRPLAQYGRWVFCLGQPLLDLDAYCLASEVDFPERTVLGAAFDGRWLMVVLAALSEVSWPAAPEAATAHPDGWASPSYFMGDVPLALRRFEMVIDPALPGPMKRRVLARSHQTLWEGVEPRATAPWHFDTEGRVAVSHVPPSSAQTVRRGEDWTRPSEAHTRLQLALSADGTVAVTRAEVALAAGDGTVAPLAEDGAAVLQVVRRGRGLAYRLAGAETPAWEVGDVTDFTPGRVDWVRRQVLCADLREGVLLLLESRQLFAGGPSPALRFSYRVVLWQRGTETVVAQTPVERTAFTMTPTYTATLVRLAEAPVAPLALMHLHAFGPSNLGLTTNFGLSLLATPLITPFRKADTFGQTRIAQSEGAWLAIRNTASTASDSASNQQVDFAGHTTMPGFATTRGTTVCSYNTNLYTRGVELIANHATGQRLGGLTGVGEDQARYHPVWLLGQPTPL
ncbi:hypothetical protein [Lysobacter sp. CA196]|uniref:hypothetical protein n=1 Tax=Lysobacter sp. CA196 TaxID=3455606 RepID=UPI003F8D3563